MPVDFFGRDLHAREFADEGGELFVDGADKRNAFDVEKYLEHKLVFSQNTEFEMYEVNVTEEDVKEVIEEEVN